MEYKNKQISNKVKSFSLIEILIVIGILIVLTVMAFPAFRSFRAESDLNNSAEKIINILRLAQSKTLASDGASQWGGYFVTSTVPHQYILFQGANYASRIPSFDEVYDLPESVEIYDINLVGGEPEVIFDRLIGSTGQAGDVSVKLKTDPTKNQTIYVENSGQVGLTVPSVPSDGERIKDSRHVHFGLGWSIQNATTVKFSFPGFSTTTVDVTDYFNVLKTEFDWEGTFDIGGVDQTFRLHTHSLDAFDTLLCIHRDRNKGKNNQEVLIYIVDEIGTDKYIAHYLNDTVATGTHANTMEEQ